MRATYLVTYVHVVYLCGSWHSLASAKVEEIVSTK